MFSIILGLTPFICITLLGFILGKIKLFNLKNARILNLFLFYIAVPALIIKIVAQSDITKIDIDQVSIYFFMQIFCGLFTYILTNKFFKRPKAESIIWALTVALSNHVILILPIAEIFYGLDITTQVSSIILMDGVILITTISFFLELTSNTKLKLSIFLRNLILNPMIMSLLIGLIIKFSNFKVSGSEFEYILVRLADCVMPVGLFSIGIILSYYSSRVFNKITLSISFIKLIVSPIIILLFGFSFLNIENYGDLLGVLLVSVGPCGATSIVFCSAYNIDPENVIKAIFISTFVSIFTISYVINLY